MKRNSNNVNTFKENLKDCLIKHSIRPAVAVCVTALVMILIFGCVFVTIRTKNDLKKVSLRLEEIVGIYDDALEKMASTDDIVSEKLSTTKRDQISKIKNEAVNASHVAADYYIFDASKNICASNKDDIGEEERESINVIWDIFSKLDASKDGFSLSLMHNGDKEMIMGRRIEQENGTRGYAIITIPQYEINEIILNCTAKIAIADGNEWVFASTANYCIDAIGKTATSFRNNRDFVAFKSQLVYEAVAKINDNMLVYAFFDVTELAKSILVMIATIIVIIIVIKLQTVKNSERMALEFTGDIVLLNDAFKEVTQGNLNAGIDMHSSKEFEEISADFAKMTNSLKEQMAKNRELAEAVAYEQVKHLSGQFNSHFLYNTLDNIRFICRLDPPLAEKMVISLSQLLRLNNSNMNELVTIREDMEYTGMYLDIMSVRFKDRFNYSIDVEDSIADALTLKLMVQPLVENAIKYGFENKEKLNVSLTAKRAGEDIVIICKDDGNGISPDVLKPIQDNLKNAENDTLHLGLYNVNRRIQLIFGDKYGLTIESDNGTRVTVKIPMKMEE